MTLVEFAAIERDVVPVFSAADDGPGDLCHLGIDLAGIDVAGAVLGEKKCYEPAAGADLEDDLVREIEPGNRILDGGVAILIVQHREMPGRKVTRKRHDHSNVFGEVDTFTN